MKDGMKGGGHTIDSLSYLYPDSGHSWLRRHVLHFRTLRTLRRAGCLFRSRGGQLGDGRSDTGGCHREGSGQFGGNNPKATDMRNIVIVPSAEVAEDLHRYYRVPRENIIVKDSGGDL